MNTCSCVAITLCSSCVLQAGNSGVTLSAWKCQRNITQALSIYMLALSSTRSERFGVMYAGGDDPAAHVLPHQLQELVVLAGLDPAASAVLKLLGLLHKRIEERGCKKLFQDDLLDVASFYRETPLAVMMQLQSRAAAGEAAAVEAEQQGAQLESGRSAEVWQEESALSAAASAAGSKLGQGDESESGVWGDGNGQDMLAHHIAQHTLAAPAAVECRAMRFVE